MRPYVIILGLVVVACGLISCYGYARIDHDKYKDNNFLKQATTAQDNNKESGQASNNPEPIVHFHAVGSGTYIYAGIFKIYDVILYSTKNSVDYQSKPLVIEFHYLRSVTKEASIKGTKQAILLNATPQEVIAFGDDWQKLLDFYEDVKTGDILMLTHDDLGLHLSYKQKNKQLLIKNNDLAEKLFAIWLGPKPLNIYLRDALLHQSQAESYLWAPKQSAAQTIINMPQLPSTDTIPHAEDIQGAIRL